MTIEKLSFYSRKIHRFGVLFAVALSLVMMVTGTAMKYPQLVPFLDPTQARLVHSAVSTYFSIVFVIMMITSLIMYTRLSLVCNPKGCQSSLKRVMPIQTQVKEVYLVL